MIDDVGFLDSGSTLGTVFTLKNNKNNNNKRKNKKR